MQRLGSEELLDLIRGMGNLSIFVMNKNGGQIAQVSSCEIGTCDEKNIVVLRTGEFYSSTVSDTVKEALASLPGIN